MRAGITWALSSSPRLSLLSLSISSLRRPNISNAFLTSLSLSLSLSPMADNKVSLALSRALLLVAFFVRRCRSLDLAR